MGVEIRELTAEDRPRVVEIASQIWGGEDWVPDALDAWLADDDGEAIGAVLDGRLIGFARRTWILPGHAWFEGIRSDPAARGCGAGRAMTEHLIDGARRSGADAIHLATYVDNEASIHIIESEGFRRVATFAYVAKEIAADAGDTPSDPEIGSASEDDVVRFADTSTFLALARRRIPRGWWFAPFDLDPRATTAHLTTRIGVRDQGELVALLCLGEPAGARGSVGLVFADGSPENLRRLLVEAHRRCAGRRIEAMVPVDSGREAALLPILKEFEYATWDDYAAAVFVYQMNLR